MTAERKSFEDGVQFAWDATSISVYETCPRKYQYEILEGWQPHTKSPHLVFGGHYATALENFYKYRATGMSVQEALETVVREAMIATWDSETGLPWMSSEPNKTRFTLIRTIIWYLDQFAEEENIHTHHLQNGKPAVELSFTIEVSDDLLFCGHLDRVVKYQDDLYVMDQKTSKHAIGTHFFDGFNPNTQMSLYTWAGKAIMHTPISGVIIDAAQVGVNFSRFSRGFTFRTKGQLDEWYESTMTVIMRAQIDTQRYHQGIDMPMNTASCGNYGGCPLRPVCSRNPEVRKNFLAAAFVKRDTLWDPLERR